MFSQKPIAYTQPNHRQEIALERIEFAIEELATVLMSHTSSQEAAKGAISGIRAAVAPVLASILKQE